MSNSFNLTINMMLTSVDIFSKYDVKECFFLEDQAACHGTQQASMQGQEAKQ